MLLHMAERPEPSESRVVASVRSWLAAQGYPLEMRTAAAFQRAGADVSQSQYILTSDGKSREVDVLARFWRMWPILTSTELDDMKPTSAHLFGLTAICECKSGPRSQKPWIVFTSSHHPIQSLPLLRFMRFGSSLGLKLLLEGARSATEIETLDIFKAPERCGYSLAVAHLKSNDNNIGSKKDANSDQGYDHAFGTLMKLTATAKAAAAELESTSALLVNFLIFPVIVVDTPIVECWLDDTNQIQLQECDRATIVWKTPKESSGLTIIDIVQESGMGAYVAQLRTAFEQLLERYREMPAPRFDDEDQSPSSARKGAT
jgi:hypothetical protein